jgi:hypothetical protein
MNDEHTKILSRYFNTKVIVDNLDYHIVKHFDYSLEDTYDQLKQLEGFSNFSTYRNGDLLYISFWR